MTAPLSDRIADAPITDIAGRWQQHVAAAFPDRALDGYPAYGRWGRKDAFPLLYLARPTESVVVEAYRRLVDPVENPALLAQIKPRILVSCSVVLTDVVDLRTADARRLVGLTMQDLQSEVDDHLAYAKCQDVAHAAHGLGRHGLVAPAATRMGETRVVFTDLLVPEKCIRRCEPDLVWKSLPADPRSAAEHDRRLRLVE